jgi:hypothetical protein
MIGQLIGGRRSPAHPSTRQPAFTHDRCGHLLLPPLAENTAKLDADLARAQSHIRSHEE